MQKPSRPWVWINAERRLSPNQVFNPHPHPHPHPHPQYTTLPRHRGGADQNKTIHSGVLLSPKMMLLQGSDIGISYVGVSETITNERKGGGGLRLDLRLI